MGIDPSVCVEAARLFILLLPAMVANGSPVVASKIIGGGTPIDGGRTFIDGRRLLGSSKTVEGFTVGVLAGLLTGIIIGLLEAGLHYYAVAGLLGGLGAMLGDLAGSFVKRRLGIPSGRPAIILDQLDFYAGAVTLLWLAGYEMSLEAVVVLGGLVLVLHLATNALAYCLGLKKVPC